MEANETVFNPKGVEGSLRKDFKLVDFPGIRAKQFALFTLLSRVRALVWVSSAATHGIDFCN